MKKLFYICFLLVLCTGCKKDPVVYQHPEGLNEYKVTLLVDGKEIRSHIVLGNQYYLRKITVNGIEKLYITFLSKYTLSSDCAVIEPRMNETFVVTLIQENNHNVQRVDSL